MNKPLVSLNPHLWHCVKSVHIHSFSCPYFPAFGLNTKRYSVSFRIQPECGKIRTRETPNTAYTFCIMRCLTVFWIRPWIFNLTSNEASIRWAIWGWLLFSPYYKWFLDIGDTIFENSNKDINLEKIFSITALCS